MGLTTSHHLQKARANVAISQSSSACYGDYDKGDGDGDERGDVRDPRPPHLRRTRQAEAGGAGITYCARRQQPTSHSDEATTYLDLPIRVHAPLYPLHGYS